MATIKYDTVYYWTGGRQVGKWCATRTQGTAIEETVRHLNRAGYVAHRGLLSVGPPEGPPDDSEFRALGL